MDISLESDGDWLEESLNPSPGRVRFSKTEKSSPLQNGDADPVFDQKSYTFDPVV
jgi:hypothetical protein